MSGIENGESITSQVIKEIVNLSIFGDLCNFFFQRLFCSKPKRGKMEERREERRKEREKKEGKKERERKV